MLYWILYMADNRAASARETSKAYWLDALKEFEKVSSEPVNLSDKILKSEFRADIMLTALMRGG